METSDFLVIALFVLGFGLISGRLRSTVITAPMIFTVFGLVVGGDGLGLIDVDIEDRVVVTVMELALVLVLFTDAARIDLAVLRTRFRWPLRILSVGLPLTIVLGTLAGLWLLGSLSFWEVAVVAIVLAPTDAALGEVVVTSPKVPVAVRQTINVESGLNDGLALPILMVALAFLEADDTGTVGYWIQFGLQQILLAVVVGVAVGYVGGRAVSWGMRTGSMSDAFQRLSALAIALTAFALAPALGGSGFIAAFVAGLTIGNTSRPICACLYEFAEAEGQLLTLLTFLFFGAAAVLPALRAADLSIVAYAVLSLTVIRVLPVFVSLAGARMRLYTKLFIGWFGPRGIASLLFGLIVLERAGMEALQEVFDIIALTVLISIFAHGLSARPLADRYGTDMSEYAERRPEMMDEMAEFEDVPEMPVRVPGPP